jgi:hypothetical protein
MHKAVDVFAHVSIFVESTSHSLLATAGCAHAIILAVGSRFPASYAGLLAGIRISAVSTPIFASKK